MQFSRLSQALFSIAIIFALIFQGSPQSAVAQSDGVAVRYSQVGGHLSPNRAMTVQFTVVNQTGADIIVHGVSFDDVLDSTTDNLNLCPRVWFGDAGYSDRPQGEDEENPPANPYPLQQPQMEGSVQLGPGEEFALAPIDLFMIQAAPNQCQNRRISLVSSVDWSYVQTYGTVFGTITDAQTGLPISAATAIITGTSNDGVVTEEVAVNANGEYAGTYTYLAGTELTVEAVADGYIANSAGITVVEGGNTVNLALEPESVPTGTISGNVVDDETGDPIPGASVVITGTDVNSDVVSEAVVADELGNFTGSTLFLAGTSVSVNASADGYEPGAQVIDELLEGTSNVSLRLVPTQDQPVVTPTETPTETPSEGTEGESEETPRATETALSTVTDLPSTGTGSSSNMGVMVSAAVVAAGALAAGIRRIQD